MSLYHRANERNPWARDPDAGMGYQLVRVAEDKATGGPSTFPSDEAIDEFIDEFALEIGAVPRESKREKLRAMVRDWHVNN